MPYNPADRFTLTPKGAEYLDALTTPAAPVEDCRATLAEHEPPCGRCEACHALYDDPNDDGRDEPFAGAEYSGAPMPADDDDVIPFP
jgi:hypothetical protein